MIRVAVVSPNPSIRAGLAGILSGGPDVSLLAEAAGVEGLEGPVAEADVLVLASVPEADLRGLPPDAAVLLLTEHADQALALAGLAGRAWGVLPLDAAEEEILAAAHALSQGLWVGYPAFMRDLLKRPALVELSGTEAPAGPVTQREMDVLGLIARGLSNKQIALQLAISEHTVKFHLSSLYAKLGATNRTEAVRIGMQQGLILL